MMMHTWLWLCWAAVTIHRPSLCLPSSLLLLLLLHRFCSQHRGRTNTCWPSCLSTTSAGAKLQKKWPRQGLPAQTTCVCVASRSSAQQPLMLTSTTPSGKEPYATGRCSRTQVSCVLCVCVASLAPRFKCTFTFSCALVFEWQHVMTNFSGSAQRRSAKHSLTARDISEITQVR